MIDSSAIGISAAFAGGVITFFASCLLPLVPVYLAYLSGVSISSMKRGNYSRYTVFKTSILFVTGFILVFIVLGATLNTFAKSINVYRGLLERVGGLLFIMLGLFMLGAFKSIRLSGEYRINLHGWFKDHQKLNAFFTGTAFGFGWTPCIGPVLAVILFWSSQQATSTKGLLLLIAYGLGIGLPFLLVGLMFEKLTPYLARVGSITNKLNTLSAIIIIVAGVLLLSGQFRIISFYFLDLFGLNKLAV